MRKPCRPESRRAPTITIWGVFVRLARANSPDTSFMVHHSPLQCQKITVLNELKNVCTRCRFSAGFIHAFPQVSVSRRLRSAHHRKQVVQNGDFLTCQEVLPAATGATGPRDMHNWNPVGRAYRRASAQNRNLTWKPGKAAHVLAKGKVPFLNFFTWKPGKAAHVLAMAYVPRVHPSSAAAQGPQSTSVFPYNRGRPRKDCYDLAQPSCFP